MKINATPETVRAIGQVFKLAGILDDRFGHADEARQIAWSEQVQRHNLLESDLLDGLQAFYDSPSERTMQVGDLIHHARIVKRARLDKEADAEREARQTAQERKAADDAHAIAAAFTPGPVTPTDRLNAADVALQCCHGKAESIAAIREYHTAKAQARKSRNLSQPKAPAGT